MRQLPNPSKSKDLKAWATELYQFMLSEPNESKKVVPQPILLQHKVDTAGRTARASTNGVLMYDPVEDAIVMSKDGAWVVLDSFVKEHGVTALTANDAGDDITFSRTFATAPNVIATPVFNTMPAKNETFTVLISNVTTTGFKARLSRIDTSFSQFIASVAGTIVWEARAA